MGKNSLYEPAYKVYESNPHAGEPGSDDGFIPRNRYAKPGFCGLTPDMSDPNNYKILNDPVLIKKKEQLRLALKEEFLKQSLDPYKAASGTGGMAFDSNVHRYITLLRTQSEFWRPSWRLTMVGISVFFLPVIATYYFGEYFKANKEKRFRSGMVAYKDRDYKFIT